MTNIHANLISIDGKGVLIAGASGSGKTLLALHLFRRCARAGISSAIISDDQVMLSGEASQLIGTAPTTIKGQIEIHGFGPVPFDPTETDAIISLFVQLGDEAGIVRFWDDENTVLEGHAIQTLHLSTKQIEAAGNAVLAALGFPIHI